MANNIELRRNTWFATLHVPPDVQHVIGKSKLFETLKTTDKRVAETRAAPIVAQWKARIAAATFDATQADGNKITARLAGCDAPERTQPYSKRATDALQSILADGPVTVDCYKKDRYERGVCRVAAPAGDVCLALIRAGLAWHYTAYEREQTPKEREDYRQAQEAAHTARRGLWQDAQPVPPWDWRKTHKRPDH